MEQNRFYSEINGRFGFGVMRLPMVNGETDHELFAQMADYFISQGFNYFDTAHGYMDGKSELAIRECVAKRYPREAFLLTNKLSDNFFSKEEDIRPLFEHQLECCGVEYFDFYLMHAQSAGNYRQYTDCRAYEIAQELKAEGKIRHVGISFHDKAEMLDRILTDHPELEAVQIQLNYVDYEDLAIESRKCYDVCVKHGKPVIIMEPVKGGSLAKLPEDATVVFDRLGRCGSDAAYAIRFAAEPENVMMVLSGMNTMEQMEENTGIMKDYKPLTAEEHAAIDEVCAVFRSKGLIPCTGCSYCTAGCPKQMKIPQMFSSMNAQKLWNSGWYYYVDTRDSAKASDCIKCGKCEKICPQHLPIRELLEQVAAQFDKQN